MPKIPEEKPLSIKGRSYSTARLLLRVRQYGKAKTRHVWLIELRGKEVVTENCLMYGEMKVEEAEVIIQIVKTYSDLRTEFEYVGLEVIDKTLVTVPTVEKR